MARAKKRRRSLTRPDKAAVPFKDLVRRDFSAETINEKWCGDLTEIPTDEGKLYLATVEDLASPEAAGLRPLRAPRRRGGCRSDQDGHRDPGWRRQRRDLPQ